MTKNEQFRLQKARSYGVWWVENDGKGKSRYIPVWAQTKRIHDAVAQCPTWEQAEIVAAFLNSPKGR